MRDEGCGAANRLCFKDGDVPKKEAPAASGQIVLKSGPAPPGKPKRRLHFKDEELSGGTPPRKASPSASGQNVLKASSGKLRRDDEKARPSERLRRDGEPPPDGEPAADGGADPGGGAVPKADKKAARENKRFEKSGRRVEKTGAKLETVRDKLAVQKPPKKPGVGKTIGRAAKYQTWKYVHGKIREVERENVGTEAVHKTELAGERVVRHTTRFIKKRIRTRPARRVRKWEKKNTKARTDHAFRNLVREPGKCSGPCSASWPAIPKSC